MRSRAPLIASFVALAALAIPGRARGQAQTPVEHTPIASVSKGEALTVAASAKVPADWMLLFWRPAGAEEFTGRSMRPGADGRLEVRIETGSVDAPKIEYFLAFKTASGIAYLPPHPPSALFETAVAGGAPSAAEASPSAPFPLRFDASLDTTLDEKAAQPVSPGFGQASNLGLNWSTSKDDFAVDVQARASYTNRLQPMAPEADLPDMRVAVSKSGHALRVGDLQLADSEFAAGGAGNRGLEYLFDDRRLYVHLFTAGTQPLQGFKGIGIPRSAAALFGGAAGFTLAEAVTFRAVFLTGRDDPALAAAGAASGMASTREGDLMALAAESRLFGTALTLSAEYAHSRYDRDVADDAGRLAGGAFRAGAALQLGPVDAKIGYRDIGRDFNTVAQPFFVNDRKRLEAGAGLTLGTVRLAGTWASERNNTSDDPEITTSKNILTQLDAGWQFLGTSSLRIGFGSSLQDARLNDNPVMQGNLLRKGFTAGLDLGFSDRLRLSLSGQKDDITSQDNPSVEGDSLGANLGLSYQAPDALTLAPTLGATRTKNKYTGESTLMLMTGLNGEVALVRKLLSVSFLAAASRYDLGAGGKSDSLNLDGGLNLKLGRWIKIGELVLSLRAAIIQSHMGGQELRDHRIFLKLDTALSPGGIQ